MNPNDLPKPTDEIEKTGGIPERTYKVLEDGRVEINEKIETTYIISARDFRTFYYVASEDSIEDMEKSLSEERIKQTKEDLKSVKEEFERIKPILKDAEEKTKEIYEAKEKQFQVERFKEELSKPKPTWNRNYLYSIIESFQKKDPHMLSKMLNEEEQSKVLKLVAERKTAQRINKKK